MWPFKKKKTEEVAPQEFAPEMEYVPQEMAYEAPAAQEAYEMPAPQGEDGISLESIMQEFAGAEAALPVEEAPAAEEVVFAAPVTEETVCFAPPASEETVCFEPPVTEETVCFQPPVTEETVCFDIPELPDEVQPPVSGDTLRVELPEEMYYPEQVSGDTVRIELPEDDDVRTDMPRSGEYSEVTGDTVSFAPITDEQLRQEPYAEGWEPQYEQPIGEYIPPQPILFHPRSRLRELKRKLVAGPERRYYELSEMGYTRLQFAIFFCLLVAVLTAGATVAYELGMLAGRVKLVAFLQLFGMLIASLLGVYQLMDGVADLFKKRFSLNTLLVLSFFACIADGVFCLKAQRVPCCAAFAVQMTMSLWSTYHERSTEQGQMDTMRKATRLDSIVTMDDYHEGCTGILRGEGQVEDFMEHYNEPSSTEKVTSLYALIAACVAILGGVAAGVLKGSVEFGLQVLATALLAAVPGTYFITTSRPKAILEKRLHKLGTVLCGWNRAAKLTGKVVFPIGHEDIYPAGCTMLNGVKFYGDRDPDQVVAYATAVVSADGGGLTPLFENLLTSRNGRIYEVENLRLYGGGGIGGEVCGEPVLVGMQDFLKEMGVEIPAGTMVSRAVYVAVDGELCGVFAVSTTKTREATQGLSTLCSYRGLRPIVVTADFMLTEEHVSDSFGVNIRRLEFPEFEVRAELAAKQPDSDAPAIALVTRDGLSSYAYAVTGARALRTATILGTVIHLVGGVLGLGMVITLALLGAAHVLIPVNMLLFQLIWMIPGLLITEWTRAI